MRTVIVSNIVSLDGFYEGPGGDVMALNMDAAFDAYNLERIRAAGTVLLGRRSFEASAPTGRTSRPHRTTPTIAPSATTTENSAGCTTRYRRSWSATGSSCRPTTRGEP